MGLQLPRDKGEKRRRAVEPAGNKMAQCGCGRVWDYVDVDGFGEVTTLDGDIEMRAGEPIHTRTDARGKECGRRVTVVEMTSRQYFYNAFLVLRDDEGKPRAGGWGGKNGNGNGSEGR